MNLIRIAAALYSLASRAFSRGMRILQSHRFKECGRNVSFNPFDTIMYEGIRVGSDVFIGPGACLLAAEADLRIGSKVLFGPNVTIITGDHPIDLRGRFIFDITAKSPGEDLPVVIEDDVWIGSGAIILKGVVVGRGAVVAAGALVRDSVPPYSIVAGIPAKVRRLRGSIDEIIAHEMKLYGRIITTSLGEPRS